MFSYLLACDISRFGCRQAMHGLHFNRMLCYLLACDRDRDPAALLGWTPDPSPRLKVTGNDRATELYACLFEWYA